MGRTCVQLIRKEKLIVDSQDGLSKEAEIHQILNTNQKRASHITLLTRARVLENEWNLLENEWNLPSFPLKIKLLRLCGDFSVSFSFNAL